MPRYRITHLARIADPLAAAVAALRGQAGGAATETVLRKADDPINLGINASFENRALMTRMTPEARNWQQKLLRDTAIQYFMYKINPWVRTCVDLIAQEATADEYAVDTVTDERTKRTGKRREDPEGVQALTIFHRHINPKQSFDRVLRGLYRDLHVCGNWYGRVQFHNDFPVAIYRIDPRTIAPFPPSGTETEITQYALYLDGRLDREPQVVDTREIIQITLNDNGENGCGLALLESLDSTLALDQSAVTYNTSFFANGAKAGDIYGLDEEMNEDQVEREREYLMANFTRTEQSFTPMFISGKMTLIRDGAAIHKDMEFIELRKWNREEVAAVYSVPLSLITGTVGALGATGKEQDRILMRESVIAPLQKQVFEDWNRQVVTDLMQITTLCLTPPKVAGIRVDLVEAAGKMVQNGATGNEARRVMHLPDHPDPAMNTEPLYLRGGIAMAGAPGSDKGVILASTGSVSTRVMDPEEKLNLASGLTADGQERAAPEGAKEDGETTAPVLPKKVPAMAGNRSNAGGKPPRPRKRR